MFSEIPRCAPVARGISETLMALDRSEDSLSICDLKNAQRISQRLIAKDSAKIVSPTRSQQLADWQASYSTVRRIDASWLEIHNEHKELAGSQPAGPGTCKFCKEYGEHLDRADLQGRSPDFNSNQRTKAS
jgi:hypothetical protein